MTPPATATPPGVAAPRYDAAELRAPLAPPAPVPAGSRRPGVLARATTAVGAIPPFAAIALLSGLSLTVIAVADARARSEQAGATPLFWLGLIGLYVPAATRLLLSRTSRNERLGLVALISVGLYLVNVIESPLVFTQFAEMDQLRTLQDIGRTHHLFSANPIAPVNSAYPGLSLVASAVAGVSGLSTHAAAVLVVALAHLVLVLAVFMFIEEIGGSAHVAGAATALYATNPDFVQFSTQFSYESLGLPLFALILLSLVRHQRRRASRWSWFIVALYTTAALVMTHHVTSFILVGVATGWTLITLVIKRRYPGARWGSLACFALFSALALGGWLAYAGGRAIDYLTAIFGPAITDSFHVLTFNSAAKVPFKGGTGQVAPLWERGAGFLSIAIILIALPIGLRILWKRHWNNGPALLLAAIALVYPVSLALRLTQAGAETSNRASDFVFLGIGFALALAVARYLRRPAGARRRIPLRLGAPLVAAVLAALFVGGITIGTPIYARQPGPYVVGADSRSVEATSLAAASWLRTHEGAGNHILTDRSNRQVMGSYGDQDPQQRDAGRIPGYDYVHVSQLVFSKVIGARERAIIRNKGIRFVVADRRLTTALPLVGVYFEKSEPGAYQHRTPLSPRSFSKFDGARGVSRVLDLGVIQIYDVTGAAR
jgi:hypothetical protein